MKIEVLQKNYQRNGIGGEGFTTFLAKIEDEILIVTMEDTRTNRCRVVNPFNLEKAYRGDRIGEALVKQGFMKDES